MKEYIYPAIFHLNSDGSYTVTFPDLPGCITEGKSLGSALYMAQDALGAWITAAQEQKYVFPEASQIGQIPVGQQEFVNLVRTETKETYAVRRTVSLPKWMDEQASEAGISLSRVLQTALEERLNA